MLELKGWEQTHHQSSQEFKPIHNWPILLVYDTYLHFPALLEKNHNATTDTKKCSKYVSELFL